MWSKQFKALNKLEHWFRQQSPQTPPLVLTQRRIYILPTGAGVFFGVLLFVMLIGAINYNNSLGFMLTFLLVGLNVISILYTFRNLLNLKVSLRNIPPVFSGERLRIPVLLDNPTHNPRYSLSLNFKNEPPVLADVAANNWVDVEISLPSKARGLHNLGRFTIQTTFPLGLFRGWSYVHLEANVLVYPKPAKRTGLPEDILYRPKQTGDKGRGSDDFAGLRSYHLGDSLRHVHWKTVAKDQGLHTKQFGGDRSDELWLDWLSLEHLDKEARIRQLTRWIIDAEQSGLSYGLRIPQTQINPNQGEAHQHNCLRALALMD